MGKSFDKIDIIFIVLISIYLLALVIGILWIILDKLEKAKLKTSATVNTDKEKEGIKVEVPKEVKEKTKSFAATKKKGSTTKKKATSTTNSTKANKAKTSTTKKKATAVSKTKNKSNVNTKTKTKNNSSNRSNGYVSPTKRKKNNRKKKSTKKSTKR